MKTIHAGVIVLALAALLLPAAGGGAEPEPVVDAAGNLRVPADYLANYQFMGTWAVAGEPGQGAKQMHVVYASPGAVAGYRANGRFPDRTVLVKEVYETATAPMTTGTVSRQQTLKGWFVMVKDDHDSHPGNKLWGDGWGWSWFDADKPTKTTSSNYTLDCKGCHVPAKDADWIYVQGYPALKR